MKKLVYVFVLILLLNVNAYAVISTGSEKLSITSFPSQAQCELTNNKGSWAVVTPGTVEVKRSKKPLNVTCVKDSFKASEKFTLKVSTLTTKGEVVENIYDTTSGFLTNLFAGAIQGASKVFGVVKNSFGTYGSTYNAEGVATIYLQLKSD